MEERVPERFDSGRAIIWLLAAFLCVIALIYGACHYVNSATETYRSYVKRVSSASKLTGIPTEDLSRLLHAAAMTNTDFETLVPGLIGFRRSVLEANAGHKRRVEAFRKIRIGRTDLAGGRNDILAVFWKFTDQVHGLKSHDDKAQIVSEIMGLDSVGLVPFLTQGSVVLRRLGAGVDGTAKLITDENVRDVEILEAAEDSTDKAWRNLLCGK